MEACKIYVGEKPLYLGWPLEKALADLGTDAKPYVIEKTTLKNVKQAVADLEDTALCAAILLTDDVGNALEKLRKFLKWTEAGGGFVKNKNEEYLFIFRRGKWDLPKGKLDKGESIETCAVREVREETGLQNVELGPFLLHTWHIFHGYSKHVLKQTTWYHMDCPSEQQLVPQTEEDIEEARWLKKEDWGIVLANTFASIKDVLSIT